MASFKAASPPLSTPPWFLCSSKELDTALSIKTGGGPPPSEKRVPTLFLLPLMERLSSRAGNARDNHRKDRPTQNPRSPAPQKTQEGCLPRSGSRGFINHQVGSSAPSSHRERKIQQALDRFPPITTPRVTAPFIILSHAAASPTEIRLAWQSVSS
ncbi:MAG: hypothetical protein EAZ65_05380 [Verrucomicrobia bacterium]|nr:MAG: hypothetical protein EAZ82_06645 [Verrucomicrobiota bacterium]TAF25631.1 MAG: hypothetical protein EAZ71_07570 [Verrucomicrobiota bacterium]TAF41303.1 MAG: hypothetical protein EAZ65_05380 [Verrucomicrobiota bacterium]